MNAKDDAKSKPQESWRLIASKIRPKGHSVCVFDVSLEAMLHLMESWWESVFAFGLIVCEYFLYPALNTASSHSSAPGYLCSLFTLKPSEITVFPKMEQSSIYFNTLCILTFNACEILYMLIFCSLCMYVYLCKLFMI